MAAQSQAGRWRCVSMCRVNVELRNRVEWGASTTTMVVTVRKRNAFAEPVERRNNKSGSTLVRSFFILQCRTLINTRVPFLGTGPRLPAFTGYSFPPRVHIHLHLSNCKVSGHRRRSAKQDDKADISGRPIVLIRLIMVCVTEYTGMIKA